VRRALGELCVPVDATLRRAIAVINAGGQGITFVRDLGKRVIGTLTDGDVRRALLSGATLDDRSLRRVMQRRFTWVGPETGRADVLDLMRARSINQVPILDAQRRLLGVHLLRELLGIRPRENWAVIMAGGQGIRLRPLTKDVPKPMLTVAGRPILERLVLHLVGWGIRRIYISVQYLSKVIERHFENGERFGCEIHYLRERRALGTAGGLALLHRRPSHPLLVMNGDLVTQVNIDHLLAAHDRGKHAATMGVRPYAIEVPFGVADVRRGRLVALREKPTERMLVNAGIYVLSPRVLQLIPRGRVFPITELLVRCLQRGLRVGAHEILDEWTDVGRKEELSRARGIT